jgi:hypothetical protein
MWRQFDKVEATFRPRALDTLKPEAADWIGVRLEWQAVWVVDEEDGGPYVGQMAWSPQWHHVDGGRFPAAWVPTEDLTEIVLLDRLAEDA